MAFPAKGLRVKWCENIGKYAGGKCHKLVATARDGWYVQVSRAAQWVSLMDLRFAREKDALRAA